jgi:hypothetical protein
MRRLSFWGMFFVLIYTAAFSFGQKTEHFYNVDKEITVGGTIKKIKMEPRYKNTAPFLVVILEENKTNTIYQIEISPVWFFDHDFHQGEYLVVKGSAYSSDKNIMNIIAREVQFSGQTLFLRDQHGFPNWRGGNGQIKRRGKGKRNFY